jgi:anthranilate synthase component 2
MNILLIDNYDSFTYNLVHLIREYDREIKLDVIRNDYLSLNELHHYDGIVLSPGPGIPSTAGMMPEVIKKFASSKKILGICLGHQAIGENWGAQLKNLDEVFHGVSSATKILDHSHYLFNGLPEIIETCRYHSWVINKNGLPPDLIITAEDESGIIMGIKHEKWDVIGLQFHPESIMTPWGKSIIFNWLDNLHKK